MAVEIKIKKLPHSEIEITGELSADLFESYRTKAISYLKKGFELPGFRKGNVPDNIFLGKVPETHILEEMAEMALAGTYPKLIEENKLDPIGRPEVSITKLAKGNPLGFTLKTAVIPEVKLPDYKKIADEMTKETEMVSVTGEEVEKAVSEIQKARAPKVETAGGEPAIEPVLPELTDDLVKTLGSFQNVAEFKEKIRENIRLEKEHAAVEKKRVKFLDALVQKSEIDLPKVIVEEEKNKLIYQLRHDVERLGLKFEEYLKNVKKTEDDIKKEWTNEAEKRAKIQFIMSEIAIKEKIAPTEEELDQEVKHLLEHNKGADETRARLYLSQVLANQKVMEFLENQRATK